MEVGCGADGSVSGSQGGLHVGSRFTSGHLGLTKKPKT